ncbi:DUF1283 domain-containing protein [Erwinia sp. OPT-41]|uniref:DUF1283 domain-containing protein n=1 Tax=Erwinia plantamica TaxID=3237104 RepID=A0ABW7CGC8_9GAMM
MPGKIHKRHRPKKKKATPQKRAAQPADGAATQCINSRNLNAYWEPVTRRCLDRTTGREAAG